MDLGEASQTTQAKRRRHEITDCRAGGGVREIVLSEPRAGLALHVRILSCSNVAVLQECGNDL